MTLEILVYESLAKLVEFLLENPVMDYSKTDLANEVGVSRSTLYRRWDVLEQLSIIRESRKYQNIQLYRLDVDSPIVNELGRLKRRLEDEVNIEKRRDLAALA